MSAGRKDKVVAEAEGEIWRWARELGVPEVAAGAACASLKELAGRGRVRLPYHLLAPSLLYLACREHGVPLLLHELVGPWMGRQVRRQELQRAVRLLAAELGLRAPPPGVAQALRALLWHLRARGIEPPEEVEQGCLRAAEKVRLVAGLQGRRPGTVAAALLLAAWRERVGEPPEELMELLVEASGTRAKSALVRVSRLVQPLLRDLPPLPGQDLDPGVVPEEAR
ncbi:MAG: hypothetical protein QXW56_05995 [Nitrososphaerota archaeon]